MYLISLSILNFGTKFAQDGISGRKWKIEQHYWVPYIEISPGTKFQLKLTILIYWAKLHQKGYFRSKTENVNSAIEFLHIRISLGSKFQLKLTNLSFWTKLTQKGRVFPV